MPYVISGTVGGIVIVSCVLKTVLSADHCGSIVSQKTQPTPQLRVPPRQKNVRGCVGL